MTALTTCPDPAQLKDLLDGALAEEHQAELQGHLDSCRRCQEALEGLVAGKESWFAAAEQLNQAGCPPETGLQRVLEASKQQGPGEETSSETPALGDDALDFLDPARDPAHLGRLRRYDVLEVVGRGGMGIVLKAFDAALHRVVAIKVLAPQLATSASARKRFEREGRAAAAVSHEHVVAIHEVDEANGLPYLVMEYVAGVSLQDKLDRTGPLELKEILRLGMQTARGLAAAHAQGLVHRDIKPANILLYNGVERVKLTDFGLARAIDDASVTHSGFVAGTPQYMAPEQARGETVDHRADLFSLGSVLYALCTGRPPFRASTTMAVLKRVSEENARPVTEVNPDIPPWLVAVIAKLHAKDPTERYQSAAEVADLLSQHLTQVQQPAAAAVLPQPSGPPSRWTRSRRWAVAAALALVVAGGLALSDATGVTKVGEVLGTVFRIRTADGTLVVEVDDPGVDVTVDDGEIILHGAGLQEIRLKPGPHRVQATKDGKPVPVDNEIITITRGGKQIVRVRREESARRPEAPAGSGPFGFPGQREHDRQRFGAVPPPPDPLAVARRAEITFRRLDANGDGFLNVDEMPQDLRAERDKWDTNHDGLIDLEEFKAYFQARMATLRVNPAEGREIRRLTWSTGRVNTVAFSPDGKILAAGGGNPGDSAGEITLWDPATGKERARIKEPAAARSVAFSPGSRTLAVGGADRNIRLYGADNGRIEKVLRGHRDEVNAVAFAPDGQTLASVSTDGWLRVWNLGTYEELAMSDVGIGPLRAVAFSPDGKIVAVGGGFPAQAQVQLFDVGSWRVRNRIGGPQGFVWSLAYSPDGKLLAAGCRNEILLWSAADSKLLTTLTPRRSQPPGTGSRPVGVFGLSFSPNGKLLAAACADNSVRLWDVASRREIAALWGHTGRVLAVAFSPDGKVLASAGTDQTVRLWDASAVGPLYPLAPAHLFPEGGAARAQTDAEHLQGDWLLLSAECDGKRIYDQQQPVVTFRGDRLEVGKPLGWSATFQLDPTQHPRRMEMRILGQARQAIYVFSGKLSGDRMVICFNRNPGGPAPDVFTTKAHPDRELWSLERVPRLAPDPLQERIGILKELATKAEKAYKQGTVPLAEVRRAQLQLLRAEAEVDQATELRVGIHEKIVNLLKDVEKQLEQLQQTGAVPDSAVLKARMDRLEAETALERARKGSR